MSAVKTRSGFEKNAQIAKMTRKKGDRKRDSLPSGSLRGCAVGIVTLFVLLALFTCAAAGGENPGIFYTPFSLCSLYLGALAAGIGAVRCTSMPVISGVTSGTLYAAAVFLLSLLPLPGSGLPSSVYWILLVTVIPAAVLGSIVGQRRAKKTGYRR